MIKTWQPIEAEAWTWGWHHLALTLRLARVDRPGSDLPNLVLSQAFLFVDGQAISDDGAFLALDLMTDSMVMRKGLSTLFLGGPANTEVLMANGGSCSSFSGSMDSIRLWAPECAPGPTACNPFGFLDPRDPQRRAVSASGILEDQVAPFRPTPNL